MMSGCILTQFLTGNKHGQSLEASGHEFYGSIAKTVQKLSKKITVRPGGGAVAPSPGVRHWSLTKYAVITGAVFLQVGPFVSPNQHHKALNAFVLSLGRFHQRLRRVEQGAK